jgi:hypothetical protein
MISWNRRLSGIGESAIETRLKYFSHPLKTLPEQDEGIDFYCILGGSGPLPSRIFLVQAKATEHFDSRWGRSFDKETIEFWLSQEYPVYIVVYDEISKNCYWVSLEEKRDAFAGMLTSPEKKTFHLTVDKTRMLKLDRNDDFVKKVNADLESLSFRLNLVRGTPQSLDKGYVRRRFTVLLPDVVLANIREGVRTSLNHLIDNYMHRNDIDTAYNLCKFLTTFDKGHYDHFVLLGNICGLLGRREEACSSYRQAIEICKEDKKWNLLKRPEDPSIENIIASIEKGMKSLNCEFSGKTVRG